MAFLGGGGMCILSNDSADWPGVDLGNLGTLN
jgi:hypothetical protein